MPVVGKIFGGLDFNDYFIPLAGQTATTLVEAKKAGAVLAYGSFITIALNFIILAFIIFQMVKHDEPHEARRACCRCGARRSTADAGRRDSAARDSRCAEALMRLRAR
jgi:large-conductance mechanosensitive channel